MSHSSMHSRSLASLSVSWLLGLRKSDEVRDDHDDRRDDVQSEQQRDVSSKHCEGDLGVIHGHSVHCSSPGARCWRRWPRRPRPHGR